MRTFTEFLTESVESDLKRTLHKVPKKHRDLIRGYRFKWEIGNTLKKDDKHIGLLNPVAKTITIAAPWSYPREFAVLHELAHQVWQEFMTADLRSEWEGILQNTKHKMRQNAEELWCMMYANHFAKNKIEIHNHPSWEQFMTRFLKKTL